ncbi:mechanosensitive ion channel family protein [Flavobacterium hiemivividum]|uniref:Mechanosensitive ion channel family protein n=1 Tax=Flavobacterium hiemivividum TaxID=2541734 RepID=A0A4R5CQV9_9FLAO|nr:mechanosensitive ion channel family protein [Flavobacterium hiemivividum]TDE00814.1 mechanosensitive ion channel family protein [Flavobacterium hiemivividum]
MNSEIDIFYKSINQSWTSFISHLPNVLFSLVVLVLGLLIIRMINKYATKFVVSKSNDPLIADFILSIISLLLTIILFVICLGVLGFDDVTNKILAAAGLSTFIIGFALKDIGENFLAGILMAFQRPFRIGDLIQIDNVKGRVIEMNLRSTTIKTLDGIDAYIPNASILKNNLENFTIDALMRSHFIISITHDDKIDEAFQLINSILMENEFVLKIPNYKTIVEKIENDVVTIGVYYWYRTDEIKAPGDQLKSDLQLKIYKALKTGGYNLPTAVVSIERIDLK